MKNFKALFLSIAATFLGMAFQSFVFAQTINGYLDPPPDKAYMCGYIQGWGCDQSSPTTDVAIQIFADNASISGTPVATGKADRYSGSALYSYCNGGDFHRFSFPVPENLKDGKNHTLVAVAKNPVTGVSKQLPGTISMNCSSGDGMIMGSVWGKPLKLITSHRLAGAIDRAVWGNEELINSIDSGRSIQYAWHIDGDWECNNPTEAGNAEGTINTIHPASILTALGLLLPPGGFDRYTFYNNILTTTMRPSFWTNASMVGHREQCSQGAYAQSGVVSRDLLVKKVTIGHKGMQNVIEFDAAITVADPVTQAVFHVPAGAMSYKFKKFYRYNPVTNALSLEYSPNPTRPEPQNNFLSSERPLPVILSTDDGNMAMGVYASNLNAVYSLQYLAFGYREMAKEPNPTDTYKSLATNVWSVDFNVAALNPGTYPFKSYAALGTLDQVKASLKQLASMYPSKRFINGAIDGIDSRIIAGWAWDEAAPEKRLRVKVFAWDNAGNKILLADVPSNLVRPGIEVYTKNGRNDYGFAILTPAFLETNRDSLKRVQVYAYDPSVTNPDTTLQFLPYPRFAMGGALYYLDTCRIAGWAVMAHDPKARLDIRIFEELSNGSLVEVAKTRANLDGGSAFRTALASMYPGLNPNDGKYVFNIPTPASLKDGRTHKMRVYAYHHLSGQKQLLILPESNKDNPWPSLNLQVCK